jgi:hypothetical protein
MANWIPNTCINDCFKGRYLLARLLPHFFIFSVCSSVQLSRSALLTRETWTPRPRWMPEHRMQMKTPKFHDVQRGYEFTWQSAQIRFSGCLRSSYNQPQNKPKYLDNGSVALRGRRSLFPSCGHRDGFVLCGFSGLKLLLYRVRAILCRIPFWASYVVLNLRQTILLEGLP